MKNVKKLSVILLFVFVTSLAFPIWKRSSRKRFTMRKGLVATFKWKGARFKIKTQYHRGSKFAQITVSVRPIGESHWDRVILARHLRNGKRYDGMGVGGYKVYLSITRMYDAENDGHERLCRKVRISVMASKNFRRRVR